MKTIDLHRGEAAVFGYGSLLSIESLELTLGHRYTGLFQPCWLKGWRRTWDIIVPNARRFYAELANERMYPDNIIYLNIRLSPGDLVIGVLFVVNEEDLFSYDGREWIYNRQEISEALSGVTLTGGPAFVYVGKSEYRLGTANSPCYAAVRATYLDTIETGLRALGEEFRLHYQSSSDPVPQHLIINDRRVRQDNTKVSLQRPCPGEVVS